MELLISLHSLLAYVVLLILVLAVANAFKGWLTKAEFFSLGRDFRLSLFALILSHMQLLIGLVVYFVSANGLNAIQTLGHGWIDSSRALARLGASHHQYPRCGADHHRLVQTQKENGGD